MAIDYPELSDLQQEASAQLTREQPSIDPTVRNSWAGSIIRSASVNAFSIIESVKDLQRQLFPQTAQGEFLEDWAEYESLERLAATPSAGVIAQEGTAGTTIPAGTGYRSSGGIDITTNAAAVIQTSGLSIASITRTSSTATATSSSAHNYASGMTIEISGSVQTEYNGIKSITVISNTQFTFDVSGSPTTPATGTISGSSTYAAINASSVQVGQSANISSGGTVSIQTPITGADSSARITFDGFTGATDIETDDALRSRVLLSRSIIQGDFTVPQIRLAAFGVAGNTRVFVKRPIIRTATDGDMQGVTPAPGQVVIYILRDNDQNILPSQLILDQTKQAIIDSGKLYAASSESDVFVFAPTPVSVDFNFSSLTPNTQTMQQAVRAQLQAFFEDQVDFEIDVTQAAYLGAINSTEDVLTNSFIESFQLSAPTGDVSVDDGEIAVLGEVTFA